jgi:type IV secretion system protein VirB9
MRWLLLASLALAGSAQGQMPRALDYDPRIETLEWRAGAELSLRTTAGGNLTMIFSPGEAVQSVVVGDPSAIEVAVAPQTDSLTLHTLHEPRDSSLTVRTQLRDYRFKVAVGPANNVAYAVRFAFEAAPTALPEPALLANTATNPYTLKGEATLRPLRVSDDGQKTYIEWRDDQALPAVFALNAQGEEETVDGYMRQGVMVIDRVYPKLVFRIGKRSAEASRSIPARGK